MKPETVRIKVDDSNKDGRWVFFIKKTDNVTKEVKAYFCQRGKWPVCYTGRLKWDYCLGWIPFDGFLLPSDISEDDFIKMVLKIWKKGVKIHDD